jgi:hypothetical protein
MPVHPTLRRAEVVKVPKNSSCLPLKYTKAELKGSGVGWIVSPKNYIHLQLQTETLFGNKVFADVISQQGGPNSFDWCLYEKRSSTHRRDG